jgi:transcriptional regulator with XRE-family HTH domain
MTGPSAAVDSSSGRSRNSRCSCFAPAPGNDEHLRASPLAVSTNSCCIPSARVVQMRRARMSFAEIAEQLAVTPQRVGQLYRDALAQIPRQNVDEHRAEELELIDTAVGALIGIATDSNTTTRRRSPPGAAYPVATSLPRFRPGVSPRGIGRVPARNGGHVSDVDDIRTESTIGERIKRLRNNYVLMTQDDLAAAAGVSTDLIRKLEQCQRHTCSIGSLHRIARALGVEVGELLGRARPQRSTDGGQALVLPIRDTLTPIDDLTGLIDDTDVPTVAELDRSVTYGWGAYWGGRYGLLAALLPDLLASRVFHSSRGMGVLLSTARES